LFFVSTDHSYCTDWGRGYLFFCFHGLHGLHGLGLWPFVFLFPRITRITRIGVGTLVFVSADHTDRTDWGQEPYLCIRGSHGSHGLGQRPLFFVSADHTDYTDWGRVLSFCLHGSLVLHGLGQGPFVFCFRGSHGSHGLGAGALSLFPRITRITRIGVGAFCFFVSADHTDYTDWGRGLCFLSPRITRIAWIKFGAFCFLSLRIMRIGGIVVVHYL